MKIARNVYSVGQYQKAREIAQQVVSVSGLDAWELIGLCSCGLDDVAGANRAHAELAGHKEHLARLIDGCRNVHDVKYRHGGFSIK